MNSNGCITRRMCWRNTWDAQTQRGQAARQLNSSDSIWTSSVAQLNVPSLSRAEKQYGTLQVLQQEDRIQWSCWLRLGRTWNWSGSGYSTSALRTEARARARARRRIPWRTKMRRQSATTITGKVTAVDIVRHPKEARTGRVRIPIRG